MSKRIRNLLSIALTGLLFASCAPKAPVLFTPQQPDMGAYTQKTQNFEIILDASSSMTGRMQGVSKFEYAKGLVKMINHTIPNIPLKGALRTFGHNKDLTASPTKLFYGMTDYTKGGLDSGLSAITRPGGFSPMGSAVNGASMDLEGLSGKSAVIIISDGMDPKNAPISEAQKLKEIYGDAVCIYTIAIDASTEGLMLMEEIASIGGCGKAFTAEEIMSPSGMAAFVSEVFLSKGMAPMVPASPADTDGDGVADEMDMCPNTPYGTPVNSKGCPMDSDGDGVFDTHDKCPATPAGAMVDQNGCWNIPNVMFDFDRYSIKEDAAPWLTHVAEVMKLNGDLSFIVHGHTDSIGSKAYNQKLSEKRAMSVIKYLEKKGVSRSRLSYKGFNFAVPVADNDTKAGRAKNRRAELVPVR